MCATKRRGPCKLANLPVHLRQAALLLCLCLLGALSLPAREQVTIQKAGTNTQVRAASAWLDGSSPNDNNNGDPSMQVRALTGQPQRALVLFDLSLVPNAGVKSATLALYVVTPPAADRTYSSRMVSSFWYEPDVTWNVRVNTRPWGAPGGDFFASPVTSASVTTTSTSVSWDITKQVQSWYNGAPNYGSIITDGDENSGTAVTTIFSSMNDITPASRPLLTLTFLQNVANLTATPGDTRVTLNWTYPTPIGTILENYTGVLILRRQGAPVDKADAPTDLGALPAVCTTIGTGTVVFANNTGATTFTDDATDTCGSPANGNKWFYKVFTRDAAGYWSTNPAGLAAPLDGSSAFSVETCALPNVAGSTQACLWTVGTHAASLAAPALNPGWQVAAGTGTNLLIVVNATSGERLYPPVSLSGAINGRAPIVDSLDSSLGKKVAYIADQDNLVYAVDVTTGQILWVRNPTGLITNAFQGGAAVVLKRYASASYTLPNDLVILGTHNGASTAANRIVALDGNTRSVRWTVAGNAGSVPPMDIISSTPSVDYVHNAIWVTTRSAAGTAQPSLWKINANTGAVLFTANLGDIDSSPSLSAFSDLLLAGTNGGILYAINPATGATLGSYNGGDGAIRGFPVAMAWSSPFNIVFCTNTLVQGVSFNAATNTFTPLWTTAVAGPSAPIVYGKIYVGSSDGKIHEIDPFTGVDGKQRAVNPASPSVVGDPSIDVLLLRIYVAATASNQHSYAFTIPF